MSNLFSPSLKLGILGGGQLGLMFTQSAMNYGIGLHILDPDPQASCSRYCSQFSVGSLVDADVVFKFGRDLDVLTIELENVSVPGLARLEEHGVKVYPQSRVIQLIQDKGLQKQFFIDKQIPTAPFVLVDGKHELPDHEARLPAVMKSRKAGYDGRGVISIHGPADFHKGFDVPSILEERIRFVKELSVLVARNPEGEIALYEVVEMEFNPEFNLVEYLMAPARITHRVALEAQRLATKIITELDMIGLLAVEFFLDSAGKLLVNELAPRPHNSGHHTIEANFVSQYEQHLRAVCGIPLGSTHARSKAVTVNLLGELGSEGPAVYDGLELLADMEGVFVHLYGKEICRPFRKMGHVTILGESLEEAYLKAGSIKDTLKVRA